MLLLGLVLGLTLLAAALTWGRLDSRRNTEAQERARLAVQVRVVEQNLARQLKGVYAALKGARSDLDDWPEAERVTLARSQLEALAEALPGLQSMQWLDASGRVRASNRREAQGRDDSAQPYFATLRGRPDAALLFVSVPFQSRPDMYSLNLSVVRLDAQGRFNGALSATLDPDYFKTLLGSVVYAKDMRSGVIHADGTVLVLVPTEVSVEGLNVARPGAPFSRHLASGQTATEMVGRSVATGDSRMIAQRTLHPIDLPMDAALVVTVSREMDAVQADWLRQTELVAALYAAFALTASLATVAWQRQRRAMTRLAAERQSLAAAEAERLALALRGGDLALWDAHLPSGQGTVNARWYEMVGRQPGEVPADHVGWEALVHPQDLPRVQALQADHVAGRSPSYEAQYRMRHRDGHWVWVLDRGRVVEHDSQGRAVRMVGTHLDISARVAGEEALRDAEARLRMASRLARLGDWRLDAASQQFSLSADVRAMLELDGDEPLSGEGVFGFLAAAPRARWRGRLLQALQDGQPFGDEFELTLRGGAIRYLQVTGEAARDAGGRIVALQGAVQDMTEARQTQQHLRALERQLREAQKMESIGTLAGGIAHDFNNILAAILGNVALAQVDLPAQHSARVSLEQIQKSSLRARSLVQQILTFSRRQLNPLVVQRLRPVIDETRALLRATLPASAHLDTALADESLWVEADATQLQQVLMNLCTNAWHALPAGRGRIEVGCARLCEADPLRQRAPELPPGDCIHLWVRDDGVGMSPVTLDRIFDPFFTTKPVGQGTGLGLSVVHGIVRGHQGAVLVDSTPGGGSTFHLLLPLAQAPEPEPGPGRVAAAALGPGVAAAENPPPAGLRVLYVDDDDVMLLMVQRLLEREGYAVAVSSDATQALADLRSGALPCDLLVSDYNMPELSGIELARQIGALRPGLPVIITSGYITDALREQAAAVGVRAMLKKERTLEELVGMVRQVLADEPGRPPATGLA